jgi:hypothetical protein
VNAANKRFFCAKFEIDTPPLFQKKTDNCLFCLVIGDKSQESKGRVQKLSGMNLKLASCSTVPASDNTKTTPNGNQLEF